MALIAYGCNQFTGGEEQAANGETESPEESSPPPSVPPSSPPTDDASPEGEDDEGNEEEAGGDSEGDGDGGEDGGEDGGAGSSAGGGGDIPAPEEPGDPCRPQDVVVTSETDKEDYAWDEEPEIEITAVNTGDQTCTVDVGPTTMEVRITSGDDRVFSSADCVRGKEGSDKRELSRGVPKTTTVTWDRTRSWEDCRDREVNASSGTYVATLHGDYTQGAKQQVFRLN